jgi:large subunit ribosomal protein L3
MSIGFAKKVGMTRLFLNGKSVPVTALLFGKNYILQQKNKDKDGYEAVQIGSVSRKKGKSPRVKHIQKYSGQESDFRFIGEFKDIVIPEDLKYFDISAFKENDELDISGNVNGRGFAGVMKRHNFAGQPASHGHQYERSAGSIGSRWPQRVLPGKRMAGHMGTNKVTLKKVKVVAVDTDLNLIFVSGSVPGSNNNYLKIKKYQK